MEPVAESLPTLLAVDDEPELLGFYRRALRRQFTITGCGDAEAARALLATTTFDVLVTDQKLPGMSGLALTTALPSSHAAMARLLLTGFADEPAVNAAIARGAIDGCANKPIDSAGLAEAIAAARATRRRRSAA